MPANTATAPVNAVAVPTRGTSQYSSATAFMEDADTNQPASIESSKNGKITSIPATSDISTAAIATAAARETSSAPSNKSSSKPGNRKRARATSEQVTVLESVFMVNRSPASRVREDLAARLNMAPRQVQVWFQNRRAKEKTQQRNPRALQHHPPMLFDQLAYANGPSDFYSMAMASTFIPVGVEAAGSAAAAVAGAGNFQAHPSSIGFASTPGPLVNPSTIQHQQQTPLSDGHGTYPIAAVTGAATNPWLNWSVDMLAQNNNGTSSLNQYLPIPGNQGMHPQSSNAGNHINAGNVLYGGFVPPSNGTAQTPSLKSAPDSMHIDYNTAAGSATATATAMAPLYAANISDSRRESEASGVTAVASPEGPGSMAMASASTATTASSAASPAATPTTGAATTDAQPTAQTTATSEPHLLGHNSSDVASTPGPAAKGSDCKSLSGISTASSVASSEVPTSAMYGDGASGAYSDIASRRPAPLALIPHHSAMNASPAALSAAGPTGGGTALQMGMGFNGMGMNMGMGISLGGGRLAMGYSSFIPEIPSYMVLDASQLSVGNWVRVPMPDTELTCLACVEPPPLKPVQRPGNHRPAELDSLVGEFQWIISSSGQRYKMVLPYSAISRIKFRESPDSAAALVDISSESVSNPQAALSLLNYALKNPQARGELSIHIYDMPTYYLQTDNGGWREISDFSENLSASNTNVHTISGSFITLFYQLRILLATCSRLKIAADPLMALWLGNMDDPYAVFSGIPHNTWIPCAEAVCLHSAKRSKSQQAGGDEETNNEKESNIYGSSALHTTSSRPPALAMAAGFSPGFTIGMPVSAVSSTIGTLTPTPTSVSCFQAHLPMNAPTPPILGSARNSVFTFYDGSSQTACQNSMAAAAMANGAGGVGTLPLKTQRSASLPFIRSATNNSNANATKINPSSSLCRTIESDGLNQAEVDGSVSLEQLGNSTDIQSAAGSSSMPGPGVTSTGANVGLGISNTPPSSAALPLRNRTSCIHLRRPAPYQVALPSGSPRVNSPQMSPSPFWHAHNIRRASRESLSSYYYGQSALGQNGQQQLNTPQSSFSNGGAFGRRESDTELALAMNNVFANGDVLGSHRRGLSDLYGAPAVSPSPLSNVTMSAVAAAASAAATNSSTSSVMQVDFTDSQNALTNPSNNGVSSQTFSAQSANASTLAGFAGSANAQPVISSDFYTSLVKQGSAISEAAGSTGGLIDADVFMALFNAMNGGTSTILEEKSSNSTSSGGSSGQEAEAPASSSTQTESVFQSNNPTLTLDPNSLLMAQTTEAKQQQLGNGAQSMNWYFDWNQPTGGGTQILPHQILATDTSYSLANSIGDNVGSASSSHGCNKGMDDGQSMHVDWESQDCCDAVTGSTSNIAEEIGPTNTVAIATSGRKQV
ncbi:hypothetical protein EDC05_004664 [Coemansia umbellata]|uniref:Homeobox domain-containing protein n=1 Tax=Coemansia umbellata TaxID=1424467 RepID=A0ABQ8PI69_9FUNG|nr:hypothetical protein EDC05_004664 [Coemansia umbellata]